SHGNAPERWSSPFARMRAGPAAGAGYAARASPILLPHAARSPRADRSRGRGMGITSRAVKSASRHPPGRPGTGPSDAGVIEPELEHAVGTEEIAAIEDDRLTQHTADPLEVRLPVLLPFRDDDECVRVLDRVVVVVRICDAVTED